MSQNTPPQIQLSMREMATQQQVSTCLQIMGMCITACNIKGQNLEYSESSIPSAEKALPGEALVAAENTFIKTCERLDSILDDKARWDSAFQQQVEADYKAAIKLNLESLEAQKKASLEISSPHSRLNPTLVRLKTGDWAAFKGDLNSPTCLIGIGSTAEECLFAFDEAFAGRITPFTHEWLEKHGVENKHEQNPLDRNRNSNPDSAPQPRQDRKRNRRSPRPPNRPSNGEDSALPPAGGS
jgi:hypothetical protein